MSTKPHILIADRIASSGIDLLQRHDAVDVSVQTGLTPAALCAVLPSYAGLIVRSATQVTADLIDAATSLQIIGRAGIGVDNIDVDAATRRGIIVMNTPEGNMNTAAEHTISMLLALSRAIPQASAEMKAGVWERHKYLGVEVVNKILGVVGLGRIGSLVVRKAQGLGMQTIAYDPYISHDAAQKLGVELMSLPDLLQQADYVTVHTPKTAETQALIGREELKRVKPGVQMINARGAALSMKRRSTTPWSTARWPVPHWMCLSRSRPLRIIRYYNWITSSVRPTWGRKLRKLRSVWPLAWPSRCSIFLSTAKLKTRLTCRIWMQKAIVPCSPTCLLPPNWVRFRYSASKAASPM
jgi:phosphoglycerate dehydrogenase-like enzyme